MKLNLITLVILLIVADLTLLFLPQSWLLTWQLALVIALALIFLFIFLHRNFFVFLAFFVVSLGYTHHSALSLLQQAQSITAQKQVVTFEVQEILHQQDYQTLIATATLADNLREQRIFLNWKAKEVPQLSEIWQAEISLRPLSARLNFGGFDRQQWYFSKGITAVGTVKSAVKIADISSLRAEKLQQVKKQTEGLSLQGLLNALAFGERAWLDKNTWSIYQQTNTAHLIAISGLHIGLAMGIGFYLARVVQVFLPTRFIHPYFPLVFGVLFALIYAYLAGFSVPTFRAISALVFVFFIQIMRRHYSPLQLFTLVVGFLLFCDPLMPLSVSFWLSCGAVGCLIVWYRYVPFSLFQWKNRPFSPKVRWILSLFHLQFGLLLFFTPLQLFLFNGLSLSGFLANLIAIPLYSFFLVPLILFAVFTNGACFSWQLANKLAEGITWLISVFQGNWFNVSFNLALILTALCCGMFMLIISSIYREPEVSSSTRQVKRARFFTLNISKSLLKNDRINVLRCSFGIMSLCFMILLFKQLSKPNWQLDTLDVGQGLATLIVKNGKGILYDTGSAWQGGNMAELEILPYLQREGITLEKLILSHDDNDHAGGASTILKAYPNMEFITPSRKNYGENHRTFCTAGRHWDWQGLHFQILSPHSIVERADNPHSCVILVDDGKHSVLLTGDAEIKNEQIFARTLGKIDVLQVGHHGSKTSTSEYLLSQVRPDIAIISSGRWNPWKFPHYSVMERLHRYKSVAKNTAISGQVRVNFFKDRLEIQQARTEFSPWYAHVIGFSSE
ncbi:DNA internalization-related competence protein ComEC/Rec2 [Haemophilus sp. CCUG 66565]|uniref:DNA internalization-related competence protein ComEC/Rec2 n=1 Tax=Haemophilus sp. CCUG 66565 TaxID=1859694 RepID=UPI0008031B75|nr:DNA internalization-related competence protein ComEC/Rec2 [Haemophilus sp. CCUG 66565]OBX90062.1 DNA internalization-related competence protein ComEC/Rec2 [Haemophilus sp. CCUG 66565]